MVKGKSEILDSTMVKRKSEIYAEFEASHFSRIVMEYCSSGDLHYLHHKQPNKSFSLDHILLLAGDSYVLFMSKSLASSLSVV
ncbi:hypothetical protein CerSpe_239270 [Prunus speciosa]